MDQKWSEMVFKTVSEPHNLLECTKIHFFCPESLKIPRKMRYLKRLVQPEVWEIGILKTSESILERFEGQKVLNCRAEGALTGECQNLPRDLGFECVRSTFSRNKRREKKFMSERNRKTVRKNVLPFDEMTVSAALFFGHLCIPRCKK